MTAERLLGYNVNTCLDSLRRQLAALDVTAEDPRSVQLLVAAITWRQARHALGLDEAPRSPRTLSQLN